MHKPDLRSVEACDDLHRLREVKDAARAAQGVVDSTTQPIVLSDSIRLFNAQHSNFTVGGRCVSIMYGGGHLGRTKEASPRVILRYGSLFRVG